MDKETREKVNATKREKTLRKEIERLTKELGYWKGKDADKFSGDFYQIVVYNWQRGHGTPIAGPILVKNLTEATLVAEALKQIYRTGFDISRGEDEIKQTIHIDISPMFKDDLRDIVIRKGMW